MIVEVSFFSFSSQNDYLMPFYSFSFFFFCVLILFVSHFFFLSRSHFHLKSFTLFLFVFPARLAYLAHLPERDITVAGTYIYIIRPSAHWHSPIQIVFNSVGYIIIYISWNYLKETVLFSKGRLDPEIQSIFISIKFIRKCRDITFIRYVSFLSIWNWFHEEFCIFSSFLIFIRMETLNEY